MNAHAAMTLPTRRPIDSDFFGELISNGSFEGREERIELRDGELTVTPSEGMLHAYVKMQLALALAAALRVLGLDWIVLADVALRLSDDRTVAPDNTLADVGEIRPGGVLAAEARLVIEVSCTTLRDDMGWKRAAYAAAGIPEYWVVDVNARTITRMWNPRAEPGAYAEEVPASFGDAVPSATIPGLTIDTAPLLR